MNLLSRYEGCLLGGAIGDALGYAVEFSSWNDIRARYGSRGITDYQLHRGKALVSDDTQMTLFTATALLSAQTRVLWQNMEESSRSYRLCQGVTEPSRASGLCQGVTEPGWADCLWAHYRDWLKTQGGGGGSISSWLTRLPVLHARRAPGNTCLSALQANHPGSPEVPINDSKGCGGVMRVAPIGLYCGRHPIEAEQETPSWCALREADHVGAVAAALTHGHELGYMPAAALVHLVARAAHGPQRDLGKIVGETCVALAEEFAGQRFLADLLGLIERAVDLAGRAMEDRAAIGQLGEGWVAEETLAIAIYCSLKYSGNFERAIIAAVNHDGDSDSTGSVTGNILGAYLGREAISEHWVAPLDCREVLETIARDLYDDVPLLVEQDMATEAAVRAWRRKYVECVSPWAT